MHRRKYILLFEIIMYLILLSLLAWWIIYPQEGRIEPLTILVFSLIIPGLGYIRRTKLKSDLYYTGVHVTCDEEGQPALSIERYNFDGLFWFFKGEMVDNIYMLDDTELDPCPCLAKLEMRKTGDWIIDISDVNPYRKYEKQIYIPIPDSHGIENHGFIFGRAHHFSTHQLRGEAYILVADHKHKMQITKLKKKLKDQLEKSAVKTELEQRYLKLVP